MYFFSNASKYEKVKIDVEKIKITDEDNNHLNVMHINKIFIYHHYSFIERNIYVIINVFIFTKCTFIFR